MSVDSLIGLITGRIGALGILGIFLVLFLFDVVHTDREFQREVDRGNKLEKALGESKKALEIAEARNRDLLEILINSSDATKRSRRVSKES